MGVFLSKSIFQNGKISILPKMIISGGHTRKINQVKFSPNGYYIASCSSDMTIKLWDLETKYCAMTFHGHTGQVFCIAFTNDSKFIVSGGYDGYIKVWDINTKVCVSTLEHKQAVHSIIITNDERRIISGGGGLIKAWDMKDKTCLQTLQSKEHCFDCIAITPNNIVIASGGGNGTIQVWDLNTKQCIFTLEGHYDEVNSISISPVENQILTGSSDSTIKLWDLDRKECISTYRGHIDGVTTVKFSADGNSFFSSSQDKNIIQKNVTTKQQIYSRKVSNQGIQSMDVSHNENLLVSCSNNSTNIHISKISEKLSQIRLIEDVNRGAENSVHVVQNSKQIISHSKQGNTQIWDFKTGKLLKEAHFFIRIDNFDSFKDSSNRVLLGTDMSGVEIWNIKEDYCEQSFKIEFSPYFTCLSPNNKLIAVASAREILIIEIKSNKEICKIVEEYINSAVRIKFSQSSKQIIAQWEKSIKIWELKTGGLRKNIQISSRINNFTISNSNENIYLTLQPCFIEIYNMKTMRKIGRKINKYQTLIKEGVRPNILFTADKKSKFLNIWKVQSPKPFFHKSIDDYQGINSISFGKDDTIVLGAEQQIGIFKLQNI